MIITVTVDVPNTLLTEVIPIICEEKSLDLEGKTATEKRQILLNALSEEMLDRFKDAAVRGRIRAADEAAKEELDPQEELEP